MDTQGYTVTPAAQQRMADHDIALEEILRTVTRPRPGDVVDDSDVAWVIAMREETQRRRAGADRIRQAQQAAAEHTPVLGAAPTDTYPEIPRAF